MKEPNLGLMTANLLDAAIALAKILDQPIESNCICVDYQFASVLICGMQMAAKSAADELMMIQERKCDGED